MENRSNLEDRAPNDGSYKYPALDRELKGRHLNGADVTFSDFTTFN